MRYLPIITILFLLAACNNDDKKPAAEGKAASLHSADFNKSFDAMMSDYYSLTEAFVNWDSAAVTSKSQALENSLKSVSLEDLKTDTAGYTTAQSTLQNTVALTVELSKTADLTTKRHSFNNLTQNIYDLLRAAKYDERKLYLQECPMAFNDTEPGLWLTDKGTDVIRNPYLGLKHPKYGNAMVECGSNKAIVDFVQEGAQQTDKKVEQIEDTSRKNEKEKH